MTAVRDIRAEPLQRLELPSGLEFHYVEAGHGAPLVLLHGVLGDWRVWEPQWAAFTERYRCIAYSRRYSTPNCNTQPSPDHSALVEAQDLRALLPLWQAEPAILVGSSYGAYTALALAVAHPELVRALVLLEPPMLRWAERSEEGRAAREAFERDVRLPARAAFLRGDAQAAVHLLTGGIAGVDVARSLSPEGMRVRMENERSIRMLTLSSDEFPWIGPDAVRALRMPVLLAAGADTPAIHEAVFGNLAAVMTQAEQHRIPAAGHGAARDNPRAFNACVLDFLAREVGVQS